CFGEAAKVVQDTKLRNQAARCGFCCNATRTVDLERDPLLTDFLVAVPESKPAALVGRRDLKHHAERFSGFRISPVCVQSEAPAIDELCRVDAVRERVARWRGGHDATAPGC